VPVAVPLVEGPAFRPTVGFGIAGAVTVTTS